MTDIRGKIEEAIVASGHESDGWLSDTAHVVDYYSSDDKLMFIKGFIHIDRLASIIIETIRDNPEEFKKFVEGEK